jgi:hypothetical protein
MVGRVNVLLAGEGGGKGEVAHCAQCRHARESPPRRCCTGIVKSGLVCVMRAGRGEHAGVWLLARSSGLVGAREGHLGDHEQVWGWVAGERRRGWVGRGVLRNAWSFSCAGTTMASRKRARESGVSEGHAAKRAVVDPNEARILALEAQLAAAEEEQKKERAKRREAEEKRIRAEKMAKAEPDSPPRRPQSRARQSRTPRAPRVSPNYSGDGTTNEIAVSAAVTAGVSICPFNCNTTKVWLRKKTALCLSWRPLRRLLWLLQKVSEALLPYVLRRLAWDGVGAAQSDVRTGVLARAVLAGFVAVAFEPLWLRLVVKLKCVGRVSRGARGQREVTLCVWSTSLAHACALQAALAGMEGDLRGCTWRCKYTGEGIGVRHL